MLTIIFFNENYKSFNASPKNIFAFFIHLHIFKKRETKNVKNNTRRRRMSFLLKIRLKI